MTLPVKSEMFAAVSGLSGKLKNERIDFAYEMKAAAVEIENRLFQNLLYIKIQPCDFGRKGDFFFIM